MCKRISPSKRKEAFKNKLRQIGFYNDLSDAYIYKNTSTLLNFKIAIMDIAELYYNKILSLFVETYRNEIATAQPGHCMKVTGFSLNRLQELLKLIQEIQTDAQTYILSETDFGDDYVSPSKLIELRNDLSIPLLVLIPINSRTSAEDSYGNATFKELSVRHLDDSLFRQLLSSLPDEIKSIVNEILTTSKIVFR